MTRKSISGIGMLGKSLTRLSKPRSKDNKKLVKKGSVMVEPSDKKSRPSNSFKRLEFMNRSNTALEKMFQKQYLEPEVYGKSKDKFMKSLAESTSLNSPSSQKSLKVGMMQSLHLRSSQDLFENEDDRMAEQNIKDIIA